MNIIKQKAAKIVVNLKLKKGEFDNQSFSSAFKSSNSFLVLMPVDNKDFQYAVNILDYLEELKKDYSILTFDYRVSLLPLRFREKVGTWSANRAKAAPISPRARHRTSSDVVTIPSDASDRPRRHRRR